MDLTYEQIRKYIDTLDRARQLELAYWILHKEGQEIDLTETAEDFASIRRGLAEIDRMQTRTTGEVMARLKARSDR